MLEITKMVNLMVMGNISGQMDQFMLEILLMERDKDLENGDLILQMEINTKDSIKKTKNQEKANTSGQKVVFSKANFQPI